MTHYGKHKQFCITGEFRESVWGLETEGAKSSRISRKAHQGEAMSEAPTERSCQGCPADSSRERSAQCSPPSYTCVVPTPVYLYSAWLDGIQGIIHDPPPWAPCREGEAGNIPVKCQMFGRGLRAVDGFGGETGNSCGAGSLEVQKFAEWNTSGPRKVEEDETE